MLDGEAKDDSFDLMRIYQFDEERMIQNVQIHLLLNYQIPTTAETFKEKYPILYPSEYIDQQTVDKYNEIILEGLTNGILV